MFYVAYRTLLVMFCVLKFYFVDFYEMFTSSPTWRLKMHVLCKVGKNIIFQNKTLPVFIPLAAQGAYESHFRWALIEILISPFFSLKLVIFEKKKINGK